MSRGTYGWQWECSVTRLVLVRWQGRVLLFPGRIYMSSAIILSVLALWFGSRFDVCKHAVILYEWKSELKVAYLRLIGELNVAVAGKHPHRQRQETYFALPKSRE